MEVRMKTNIWDLLKIKKIGFINQKAKYRGPQFRIFFIALLAGNRSVIINTKIINGTITIDHDYGCIAYNCYVRNNDRDAFAIKRLKDAKEA